MQNLERKRNRSHGNRIMCPADFEPGQNVRTPVSRTTPEARARPVALVDRRSDRLCCPVHGDLECTSKSKARPDRGRASFLGLPKQLGSRGSLGATLRRDRLCYFAHEEGLRVRLRTSPLQTDDRVSGLGRDEIALSVGAGYFKFAVLALSSL